MGWTKREVEQNLVILGDGEGNVAKVSGLLASVKPDPRYPDNKRFELIDRDGTAKSVAGSAAINSQLGAQDIGRFVRLVFTGWGKSPNGRFKVIDVFVYDGDITDDMRKWPQWTELNSKNGAANLSEKPSALADADPDDLPF